MTCKNITPKVDTPSSKKYRHLQVDELPIIEVFEKLDHNQLLAEYKAKHGKELKPIKRRNPKHKVPHNISCPRCQAPHVYIYDNKGGKGQYCCKICGLPFTKGQDYSKTISFKCPYCEKTLEKIKVKKQFIIHKCKNDYCSFYQHNLAVMTKKEKELFAQNPYAFKLHYIYHEFTFDFKPLSKKSTVIPKVDITKIYATNHILDFSAHLLR